MNKLIFLLTFGVSCFVQAEELKVISSDDLNPQEKINAPTGVVDAYGNIQFKYPINKNAPNEGTKPNPAKINSAPKEETPKPKFIKGPNKQWSADFELAVLGSTQGITLGINYDWSQWSFGVRGRYLLRSVPELSEDYTLQMFDARLAYHMFPRWYALNQTKSVFDPEIFVSAGTFQGSSNLENKLSLMTASLGVAVGYNLHKNYTVRMGVESIQTPQGYLGANSFVGLRINFR